MSTETGSDQPSAALDETVVTDGTGGTVSPEERAAIVSPEDRAAANKAMMIPLQRETILPSSDRGRLAAIVATCSLAGLAGGMALSMLAETHRAAAASARSQPEMRLRGDFVDADQDITWLGLQIADVPSCGGARVRAVVPGSPAAHEGFKTNDVVISYGGDRVCDADHLIAVVRGSEIGATPHVGLRRGSERLELSPTLGVMPSAIRAKLY